MKPARLTELRLTDFKTFRDEVLPLGKLTLVIGGNAVGKSNALDGLLTLARLFSGLPVREALDGTRKAPSPIRGGTQGCIPAGKGGFAVGCTIEDGDNSLTIEVRLSRERKFLDLKAEDGERPTAGSPDDRPLTLAVAVTDSLNCTAELTVAERGPRRADHTEATSTQVNSATTHVSPRVNLVAEVEKQDPGQGEVVEHLLSALDRLLLLTPEPDKMRGYVPITDTELQTDASNLSATIEAMRTSAPESFGKLENLASSLSKGRITALESITTSVGDVQLSFREGDARIPARLASDGTLRLLAFGSALLSSPSLDLQPGSEQLIMIEEIERGLYPAQAGLLLNLLEQELEQRATAILSTTHSPALLSALPAKHHPHIIVCSRSSETGLSRLTPLTELPGYVDLLASGGVGAALSTDRLDDAHRQREGLSPEFAAFLESM